MPEENPPDWKKQFEQAERDRYLQGLREREAIRAANKERELQSIELKRKNAEVTAHNYRAHLARWMKYRQGLQEHLAANQVLREKVLKQMAIGYKRRLRFFLARDLVEEEDEGGIN